MTENISVVIPAYNAAPFIERAIYSALEQTRAPMEVIVVDDGSADETANVVRSLLGREPGVRLVQLPINRGPAAARNAGFDAALGDWIAILDADDIFLPDRLHDLLAVTADADVVADNFRYYDAVTGETGPAGLPESDSVEFIDRYRYANARWDHADLGLLQTMIRRSFLAERGLRYPEESRHGEDYLFILRALIAGARFKVLMKPGYLYTMRNSGWSRTAVDYDGMAEKLGRAIREPEFQADRRLVTLLRDRQSVIQELADSHRMAEAIRTRSIKGMLKLALRQPCARAMLTQRVFARMRNAARLRS